MLSRRRNRSSQKLRKARSCDSYRNRGDNVSADDEVARYHALTAAEIAFEREYRIRAGRPPSSSPERKENARAPLQRTESIRFAGSKAVPARGSSITRRHVAASNAAECYPLEADFAGNGSVTLMPADTVLTAQPELSSTVSAETVSKRPLRNATSLFDTRRAFSARQRAEDVPLTAPTLHTQRSSGFDDSCMQNSSCGLQDGTTSARLGQNKYIDRADGFLDERYLTKASPVRGEPRTMPVLGRPRHPPKPLRRTVRSNSTTSYGSGIASDPKTIAPAVPSNPISLRVWNISSSVKGKVKRVFRKASGASEPVPEQQVGAHKAHFGNGLSSFEDEYRYPFVPMPDENMVSRCSSRASSPSIPAAFNPLNPARSLRSMDCVNSDGLKSRVTSWANSELSEGTMRLQPTDFKRLSIIDEHGGPHQPSSSAGWAGSNRCGRRVHEYFRKPLRAGTCRMTEPVDSQAMFSALQQRLNEIKEKEERRHQGKNNTLNEAQRETSACSLDTVARKSPSESTDASDTSARIEGSLSEAEEDCEVSSVHNDIKAGFDDVPNLSGRQSRASKHKRSLAYIPQDLLAPVPSDQGWHPFDGEESHTDCNPALFQRDPRSSGFSPHRKAMLAKIAEEDGRATVYDPELIAPNLLATHFEETTESNTSSRSDSESNYSHVGGTAEINARHRQISAHPLVAHAEVTSEAGRTLTAVTNTRISVESDGSSESSGIDRDLSRSKGRTEYWHRLNNSYGRPQGQGSKHVREHAQVFEDETDEKARLSLSQEQVFETPSRKPVTHMSVSKLQNSATRNKASREPLAERHVSHANRLSGQSTIFERENAVPDQVRPENRRTSTNQQRPLPGSRPLKQKASVASIASQRSRSGSPNQQCHQGGRSGSLSERGPANAGTRSSPEQITRLRRLQSGRSLQAQALYDHDASPNAYDQHNRKKYPRSQRFDGSSPFIDQGAEEKRTPKGSRMVEEFLSSRRDRQVSEQSLGPVFI